MVNFATVRPSNPAVFRIHLVAHDSVTWRCSVAHPGVHTSATVTASSVSPGVSFGSSEAGETRVSLRAVDRQGRRSY